MRLHELECMHHICLVMMTSLTSVSDGLEGRGERENERGALEIYTYKGIKILSNSEITLDILSLTSNPCTIAGRCPLCVDAIKKA